MFCWFVVALAITAPFSLLCSPIDDAVNVFTSGDGGFPCIRIPAITRTTNSTLVAFAECRAWTGDGCNPTTTTTNFSLSLSPKLSKASNSNVKLSTTYVCLKQSFDNGATWSNISFPFGKTASYHTSSQPTVVYDQIGHKLILQYLNQTNSSVFQTTSTDNGVTWTDPTNIGVLYIGSEYQASDTGPGRGLQLLSKYSNTNGYHGRILFIAHHGSYETDVVWYSDDLGITYKVSETLLEHMDEAQLVELSNGSVVANMRNDHYFPDDCDCRGISVSNNGGTTFTTPSGDVELKSPVCQASVISVNQTNGNYVLYFSNPDSTSARINMTVKRSLDNGHSWQNYYNVFGGPSAYSCLTTINSDEYIGLLWETNSTGCSGESCRVVFSQIPM